MVIDYSNLLVRSSFAFRLINPFYVKILYLHQYFKTPEEGGAIRSYHIAKALVKAGHEVILITTHNRPKKTHQLIEGIQVIYLPIYYKNDLSFLRRIQSYFTFSKQAIKEAKTIQGIDLVYASSTPLTVGLAALKLKRPFVFEVRDLWPKIPIHLGYLNPIIGQYFYWLERKIYTKSKAIISLSPETKKYIDELGFEEKNHLITNMADCDFFTPQLITSKEKFTICYTGTFGVANHLEYIIDLAKLAHQQQLLIQFILVGEGKEYNHIRFLARHLPNITIEQFTNKKEICAVLNKSHASITSFLEHPALQGMSPNKFFDGLAAGKLMVVNTKGWLKDYVENNVCGFYYPPTNPQAFINKIIEYINNEARLSSAQQQARNCAERDFSVQKLTTKVISILEQLIPQTSDDNVIH